MPDIAPKKGKARKIQSIPRDRRGQEMIGGEDEYEDLDARIDAEMNTEKSAP
jgi:hypothetical protein